MFHNCNKHKSCVCFSKSHIKNTRCYKECFDVSSRDMYEVFEVKVQKD
jgi:hypothetical protein